MASSSLRRTKIPENGHRFERLSEQSTDDFSLIVVDKQSINALCDNYPFEGQSSFRGTIHYQEEAEIGEGRNIELQFEFRDESDLFILESEVDIPSVGSVIDRLNALAPEEFVIYQSLTVHRERLWKFFKRASQLIEITVISEHGEKMDFSELNLDQPKDFRQYPIESATVIFDYTDKQIVTRYTNGKLSINSDNPQAREYIIQLFERDVLGSEE